MKVFCCILLSMMFISCDYIFDLDAFTPNELVEDDYRLFKGTPAWELAKATRSGNTKKMEEIINKNPVIVNDQEPKYGQTLLMLTILNQQYKSFKTLLDNGADVNIINHAKDESTALLYAVSMPWYNIKFVDALVQRGANVNVKGKNIIWTPLIVAVTSKRIDFVRCLIENGADINYSDEKGNSAITEAMILGEYEIAYLLLQKGADYKRPIYYKPTSSISAELRDSLDNKGDPVYLVDYLNSSDPNPLDSKHKYKLMMIDFLKKRGISN